MEYSELIKAVDRDNRSKANELFKSLTPRLIRFLKVHMDASKQDAEDCTQQALIKAIDAIKEGKIRDKERILSFLLTTCRHTYLNFLKKNNRYLFDEISNTQTQKPRQLLALLDKERRKLLEWCMNQLSESYRAFIDFWFHHPNATAKATATHFDISTANVWTRKHRVIKKLSECCQKKDNI